MGALWKSILPVDFWEYHLECLVFCLWIRRDPLIACLQHEQHGEECLE